jgi:hypothetical protein
LRDAILLDILAHRGGITVPLATVFMEKPVELEKSAHSGVLALVDTDMRSVVMIKPVNEGGSDDSAPVMAFDPALASGDRVDSYKRAALKLAHSLPDSYLYLGGMRTYLKRSNAAVNVFPSS